MTNHYLHIENEIEDSYDFNWSDNVFIGSATVAKDKVSDFCREKADEMRNSNLKNYDYYFNLENKTEAFIKSVQELADRLGVKYELNVKEQDYEIRNRT